MDIDIPQISNENKELNLSDLLQLETEDEVSSERIIQENDFAYEENSKKEELEVVHSIKLYSKDLNVQAHPKKGLLSVNLS